MPGFVLPVSKVSRTLATMWEVDASADSATLSEFRASQMNLILHFGATVTAEESLVCLNSALSFAEKYPCRIIVLCPVPLQTDNAHALEAKIHSQCSIGESLRDKCCTEAIILGYTPEEAEYLNDQVSIWLETDLPTYYWLHRLPAELVKDKYSGLMDNCTRVLIDSSIEPQGYAAQIPLPETRGGMSDLATARLLPARQSIGQFLSGYNPRALVHSLQTVKVRHAEGRRGEGASLLAWQRECIEATEKRLGKDLDISFEVESGGCKEKCNCLEIEWEYSKGFYFRWTHCSENSSGRIQANFGYGEIDFPIALKLLDESQALSEALFF